MITSFFKPKRSHNNVDDDAPNSNDTENYENYQQKQQRDNISSGSCGKKNNEHELSMNNPTKKRKTGSANMSAEALQLISYLKDQNNDDDDKNDHDECWKSALERHFLTPSFTRLASFVENQRR
jgi:hypothetical protein